MTDVQTGTGAERRPEESGPGSTRRVVLLGAGAVGATAVLSACGSSGGGSNPNGSDFGTNPIPAGSEGPATAGGADAGAAAVLAAAADIPAGGGLITEKYVITQPSAGTYKAFSKICTHQSCEVTKVDAGVILCPCHNSTFSIENGQPTGGPATLPLPETKVKLADGNIVEA